MRFTLQCGVLIMIEINWDEAPEWATHEGTPKGMQNNSRYWVGENNYQCRRVNGVMNTYGKEYTWYFSTFTDLTARTYKPVYTQAMCDAGTLPSVGMECCYSSSSMVIWNECTVIAYYDGFVWTSDNGIRSLANTKFKPIDTRTDEEKAFDNYWSNLKDCNDVVEFKEALKLSFVAGLNYDWGI